MVFIDFKMAFDLMNRNSLLEKLKFYHFDQHMLKWFKSYLSNIFQNVQIGTSISKSETISTGVQQGSIIGTLLFLLFINDLP